MLVLERPAPAQAGIHHIQVQHQTSSAQFGPFGKPSEFNGKIHAIVIRTGRSRIAFSSRARIFRFRPHGADGVPGVGPRHGGKIIIRGHGRRIMLKVSTVPELAGNYRFCSSCFSLNVCIRREKWKNAAGPFPEPIPGEYGYCYSAAASELSEVRGTPSVRRRHLMTEIRAERATLSW